MLLIIGILFGITICSIFTPTNDCGVDIQKAIESGGITLD